MLMRPGSLGIMTPFAWKRCAASSLLDMPVAGPLEATIHSMQSELTAKAAESSDMQRRWLAMQTELVALQVCWMLMRSEAMLLNGSRGGS